MDKNLRTAILKTVDILRECDIKVSLNSFRDTEKWVVGEDIKPKTIITTMSGTIKLLVYYKEYPKAKKASEKLVNYYNVTVGKDYLTFTYSAKEIEIEQNAQTADDSKIESVIKKVEKLLALANDKANEHEAISASLMAQKLLAKYGLSLDDVDGKGKDKEIPIEEVSVDMGGGNKWKYRLVSVIANNFRCKAYVTNRTLFTFYGYRDDIMTARAVFTYLFNTANRLGKDYMKSRKKEGDSVNQGTFNYYCVGFVDAVNAELSRQSTELMIVTPHSVEDAFNEKFKNSKAIKATVTVNADDIDAYEQGKKDGKNALNGRYIEDNSKYIEES